MKSLWYDRDGHPVTAQDASELRLHDPEYYRIAESHVAGARVSTVWLGLDHSHRDGDRPLIFETLVQGGKHDQHMTRYSTEAEAREGHRRIVRRVTPWWRRIWTR